MQKSCPGSVMAGSSASRLVTSHVGSRTLLSFRLDVTRSGVRRSSRLVRFLVKLLTLVSESRPIQILAIFLFVAGSCHFPSSSSVSAIGNPRTNVRPLTGRKFERTPERLARGEYLVRGVGYCFYCHAPSNFKAPGWPPVPGKEGSGFDNASLGFPGQVAPNITPDNETGAGLWTDDMLARAIREGVGHDGHFLDPAAMPYEFYRLMSDEDLASIVVLLRSIPPVKNPLPAGTHDDARFSRYAIPVTAPVPPPDLSTPERKRAYLVQIAGYQFCHTLRDSNRRSLAGLEFGGGDLITNSLSQASSANLTPDPSGISYYDEARFLNTLRTGSVGARELSPNMPWWYFGHMTDDDLKAIFAYLRTIKPVHHEVDNSKPVTFCRICRRTHGGGSLN